MIRMRRIAALALAAAAAACLAACAGLPSSSPVNPGLAPGETSSQPEYVFIPDRPQPGASPEQIVEGFIRAGTGPGGNGQWDRAREFLAPDTEWNPQAGVIVDMSGDRVTTAAQEGHVDMSLIATATVDARGTYQRVEAGTRTLSFELARQSDGEWRITEAPDGIVLSRDFFPSVFHRYAVFYFDQSWQYLVPDVRWFPVENAASRVTDALVNQEPSDWLAASVYSSFPDSVSAVPAVPTTAGSTAEVELSGAALSLDADTLDRMLTQLEASLATTGVTSVEMEVDSAPVAASVVDTRSTRVAGVPLVQNAEGFGFLTGETIEPIPGLSQAVGAVDAVAVQVGAERDYATALLADGHVVRLDAESAGAVVLDERPALIDPSIDPAGTVWSVPRDHPSDVVAFTLEGQRIEVAGAWPGAGTVVAMAVSRDGSRIAALVSTAGRVAVWAAGIERDEAGVPVRLGDPIELGVATGAPVGLAWLDDVTVGALTRAEDGSTVLEQVVGGPSSTTAAAGVMVQIAGSTSVASVRLLDDDGVLFVKRSTTWEQTATDVDTLATQQGSPEQGAGQ